MTNLYEIKTNKIEVSCVHDTSTRTVDIQTYSIYYYAYEKMYSRVLICILIMLMMSNIMKITMI